LFIFFLDAIVRNGSSRYEGSEVQMRAWREAEGGIACLAALEDEVLVVQPAATLRAALEKVWISCSYIRGAWRVRLGRWHWPLVSPLLPVDLVAYVAAERPEWRVWIEEEERRRGLRPADPLATVSVAGLAPPEDADHPWHRLYPYQRLGVQWVVAVGGRGILGDDMGLGKTPQAWMVLERDADARRALVVCPGSVLVNWTREGARWAPSWTSSVAWSSRDLEKLVKAPPQDRHAVVVSWGLLSRPASVAALRRIGFDAVVADEAHYAKNPEAARTQAVIGLFHSARIRLPLSGTPIKSRPAEFWSLLHAVDPIRFHSFFPWGETFCGAKDRRIGAKVVRTYDGSARLPQLARLTTPYVLRREKREVLTDLPPKSRQTLPLVVSRALVEETTDLLQQIRDQARAGAESPRALGELGKLRQRIGLEKVEAAVEWATDAHANGEPTVLFVYHREVGQRLFAGLQKAGLRVGMILGDTNAKDRQPVVDAFQRGDLDVLVGSESIKEGITLVRSAFSCQVEYWWTPGDMEQAEDRLCRNGQTRPVTNVYLHAENTLDDHVARLIEDKREVVRESLVRDGFHKALLRRLTEGT
jgi:SWI/SNF-related matrix-associated actin-dependent regulator 1 of chromatin subfamily A